MTAVETYSFGEWLKQRREKLRLTQRDLATMTYCSVPTIKKIEADERHPSLELAEQLALTLKIPESERETFIEVARGERPVDLLWQVPDEAAPSTLPFHAPIPLPKPATPFVGRAAELAQISERLVDPNCRLLTLVGPGGMGKTRLALATAQALQSAFMEGAVFVSLAAITDMALIPDTLARSLRLVLSGPAAEQVMAYLHRRSLLLVLDNCEQLEGDAVWLSELLANAPGIKLLVTSRERLHLAEEWVYIVPELAQAIDLFIGTARRVKQGFDAGAEKLAIVHICQLVENLPLAVELAASWTPHMPCAQIADHIQRDLAILATDVRNVPDRHRSVQAVFDQSWNLLLTAEQNALMRLSIFRGGWQAAEALPVAVADLLLLRRLVDKSLVRVGENGRYDLHELIRQYISRKLKESGVEAETHQRHFEAYLSLATQLDSAQFQPLSSMEALTRFDQEQDNFRAALAWSLDNGYTGMSLDLMLHLSLYWFRRGTLYEAGEWGIRAIQQAGNLESTPLCIALAFTCTMLGLQGRYAEAQSFVDRIMPMAHRLEDPEALIVSYFSYVYSSVNTEQALDGLHKGIAIIEATGKLPHFKALYHIAAATWYQSVGRYAEARDYYQKGLDLFRQMGAIDMTADPIGRFGQLALQEGRVQEAYELTLESATLARAMGREMSYIEWGGARLGLIQLYLGEYEAAERSLQEALLLFADISHNMRWQQEALSYLSEVALTRGDVTAAADRLQESLAICQTLYRQLKATPKLEGTADALPVDLIAFGARVTLVAAAQGHHERATTLYSLTEYFRIQTGQVMIPPLQAKLDEAMKTARAHLSSSQFDDAWKAGQAMSLSAAFEFVLNEN